MFLGKGRARVTDSYSVTPRPQTSAAGPSVPIVSARHCSGAMYAVVPMGPSSVRISVSVRAMPRSINVGASAMITFFGLTSMWTSPASCMAASAPASSRPTDETSAAVSARVRRTNVESRGPSSHSRAMYGLSPSMEQSRSRTMAGWLKRCRARASRARARRERSLSTWLGRRSLRTIFDPSRSLRASHASQRLPPPSSVSATRPARISSPSRNSQPGRVVLNWC